MQSSFDVAKLGQVFTPSPVVELMISLMKNKGEVLEPSGGNGAFSRQLDNCTSIEIDPRHAFPGTLVMDFFDLPRTRKFSSIIGNPPFVRYRDIKESTKIKLDSQIFDSRSNLYLFFIEKCLDHLEPGGELIFIVPRDFLKSTSSIYLNKLMFSMGTITHLIDLGDSKIFQDAVPNCVIFRFEEGNTSKRTNFVELSINARNINMKFNEIPWQVREFRESDGQLLFTTVLSEIRLKDIASVKVGAVSGMDTIFANEEVGNMEFVFSETVKTGRVRKMIWVEDPDQIPDYLLQHKEALLSRRIKKFDESNWWSWGRGFPRLQAPRVYVNAKTRQTSPFFLHECINFDGSILGIFPKYKVNLIEFCNELNSMDWSQLGFRCDGRFIFSQRSLENAPLPGSFKKFLINQ